MRSRTRKRDPHGALDLIEEAVHLLRLAPLSILLTYFIGTGPFVLAVLYFWSDMAMSPFAARHCAEAAAGMTLLYLWMKSWQSVYATRLKCFAANERPPELGMRGILRLIGQQTTHQPYSLFVLPVSFLAFLPFGWAYAFYHNLSLTGNGEEKDWKRARTKAWQLAGLWPGQNHRLIAVFFLFVVVVFINLRALILVIPFLIRTLFGIETVFSLSGEHLLNTTFAAVVGGMTYLCVNPLIKAVYVLRCFYGESLHSGADLSSELKSILPGKKRSAAIMVFAFLAALWWPLNVPAEEKAQEKIVNAEKLNETIGKVIQQREYQWRFPRDRNEGDDVTKSVVMEFLEGFYRWFQKWWNRIQDWISGFFPDSKTKDDSVSDTSFTAQQRLWYILMASAVLILAAAVWIVWKRKKAEAAVIQAEPLSVVPDVTDENVLANQLPEEEWQSMARDFLARGEMRLALRALFLATLASLSRMELISIAKFKSNLDYKNELQRRAYTRNELQHLFSENISLFERGWYGIHEVNEEILTRFGMNQNRMRTLAQE